MEKKQTTDFTESLTENIKDAFEKFDQQEDIQALKETAKEVANSASVFIQKYPLQTVIGAVALGFVLGSAVSRRRSL